MFKKLKDKIAEDSKISPSKFQSGTDPDKNGNATTVTESTMELHAEIDNKDVEINKLKAELEKVKQEKDETIEKLKDFFNQKQIESQSEVEQIRNDALNSLLTLETKIKEKLQSEFDWKELELKEDFNERIEKLNSSQNTERYLVETQDLLRAAETQNIELTTNLKDMTLKYNDLEMNHLELIKENGGTIKKIAGLEKDIFKHLRQIKMLEVQLKSVRDDLTVAMNRKAAIEEEYSRLEIEREALQKEVNIFKVKTESFNALKGEYNLLQEVSRKQEDKNCSLLEEIQQLKKTVEEIPTLRKTLDKLELNKEQNESDEANKNCSKVTVEKDELKRETECIGFYKNDIERLTNKNEELERILDETLVTLSAVTANPDCTDFTAIFEYLRNVIFNYMNGKESLVMAKVIAAVCKFDEEQTELVLQREQQKQSLLGQFFTS